MGVLGDAQGAAGDSPGEVGESKLRRIMKNLAWLQVQLTEECDKEVGLLLRERERLVEQNKKLSSPFPAPFSNSFSEGDVPSEVDISPPCGSGGLLLPMTADRRESSSSEPTTPRIVSPFAANGVQHNQFGHVTSESRRLEDVLHRTLQEVLQVRLPHPRSLSPDCTAIESSETPRRPMGQSDFCFGSDAPWQGASEDAWEDCNIPLPEETQEEEAHQTLSRPDQGCSPKASDGGRGSMTEWLSAQLSVPPTFEERGVIRTRLEQFVESRIFSMVSGLIVCINAVYVGVYADFTLQNEQRRIEGRDFSGSLGYVVVTQLFDFYFLFEIIIRMCAERRRFLWGKNMSWNVFDTLIVVLSLGGTAMSADFAAVPQVSYLRILRLAGVLHTVRFFRLPVFSHLRMVSNAVMQTVPICIWSSIIFWFCLYMSGVAFTLGIARKMQTMERLVSEAGVVDERAASDVQKVTKYFPSLLGGMKHLFMGVTGGIDWEAIYLSLEPLDFWYQLGYLVYTLFLLFAVINVISGMVIERAFKVVKQDRDFWITEAQHQGTMYDERVRGLFHQIDLDASGTVTWEEFSDAMNNPHVEAYLSFIEIDAVDLFDVFMLLDKDGNQKIEIDEFVDGVHELHGVVHKAQVKQIHNLITTVLDVVGEILHLQLRGSPSHEVKEKGRQLVSKVNAVSRASGRTNQPGTRKSLQFCGGRLSTPTD